MLSMTFCNYIEQFMSIKYYVGLIRTSHRCMLSNNIMVSIVHIKKQTNKHDITMVLFHKQTNWPCFFWPRQNPFSLLQCVFSFLPPLACVPLPASVFPALQSWDEVYQVWILPSPPLYPEYPHHPGPAVNSLFWFILHIYSGPTCKNSLDTESIFKNVLILRYKISNWVSSAASVFFNFTFWTTLSVTLNQLVLRPFSWTY